MGVARGPRGPGEEVDVRATADALRREGGDAVARALAVLRGREGEVAAALGGEGLQAEVVLERGGTHRLVFAPDGTTARLRPGGALATRFSPHLTVRGGCAEVLGLVMGEIDPARAVYRGVLVLHVAPHELVPRYAGLMRVLATGLAGLAAQPPGDGSGAPPGGPG